MFIHLWPGFTSFYPGLTFYITKFLIFCPSCSDNCSWTFLFQFVSLLDLFLWTDYEHWFRWLTGLLELRQLKLFDDCTWWVHINGQSVWFMVAVLRVIEHLTRLQASQSFKHQTSIRNFHMQFVAVSVTMFIVLPIMYHWTVFYKLQDTTHCLSVFVNKVQELWIWCPLSTVYPSTVCRLMTFCYWVRLTWLKLA